MKTERTYTADEVLDAVCLWEAAMELEKTNHSHERNPFISKLFDDGVYEARERVIGMLDTCNKEYRIAEEHGEFDYPYDWEWCPRWLLRFITLPHERPITRIAAICDETRAEFGDS